jgi:hypothetical protein
MLQVDRSQTPVLNYRASRRPTSFILLSRWREIAFFAGAKWKKGKASKKIPVKTVRSGTASRDFFLFRLEYPMPGDPLQVAFIVTLC